MSDPYPLKELLPSQAFPEPQPEKPLMEEAGKTLTDTTPQVETSPAAFPLAVGTDEPAVESRIQKVCKMSCVTTISSLMVIAWASALMLCSGFSSYRIATTVPVLHSLDFLVKYFYYPTAAVLVVVFLLSPVYAVVGDVRCGNFRMLVAVVTSLFIAGIVMPLLMFLAVGIFQANAIQFGRAGLRDTSSPELSAFVHWYYWALYLPTFLSGAPAFSMFVFGNNPVSLTLSLIALVFSGVFIFAFLVLFVVTFIIHCVRCVKHKIATEPPAHHKLKNPVTLVCRVTQYALQRPASPGHRGFFPRINNTRQSKGGPADDDEVESVAKFWLLVLLMASLFGFVFWDDMWAVSLVNALMDGPLNVDYGSPESNYFTNSQVTTAAVIVICVPVYQLIVRPFMGKYSFPLLWRILIGLILELISLAVVTWSSAVTTSRIGSEAISTVSDYICRGQDFPNLPEAEIFDWEILFIPQVISGLSQLLVFPAVIELILRNAPRVMHGLLIGLWYSLQSIHLIVSIIETATCAVLYWQYYLMKIALVLISIIMFGMTAFYYKRKQALFSCHSTSVEDQAEVVASSKGAVKLLS